MAGSKLASSDKSGEEVERKTYYVELGVDEGPWRAMIVEDPEDGTPFTPSRAERIAVEDASRVHPEGRYTPFLTRRIMRKERLEEIGRLMDNGTWEGWPLGSTND